MISLLRYRDCPTWCRESRCNHARCSEKRVSAVSLSTTRFVCLARFDLDIDIAGFYAFHESYTSKPLCLSAAPWMAVCTAGIDREGRNWERNKWAVAMVLSGSTLKPSRDSTLSTPVWLMEFLLVVIASHVSNQRFGTLFFGIFVDFLYCHVHFKVFQGIVYRTVTLLPGRMVRRDVVTALALEYQNCICVLAAPLGIRLAGYKIREHIHW